MHSAGEDIPARTSSERRKVLGKFPRPLVAAVAAVLAFGSQCLFDGGGAHFVTAFARIFFRSWYRVRNFLRLFRE